MELEYYTESTNLIVWVEPAEMSDIVNILRESLDEAKEKKMHIPVLDHDFIYNLLSSKVKRGIVFNFATLEVGMYFLQKVRASMDAPEEIISLSDNLDLLWANVRPYCVIDTTLH